MALIVYLFIITLIESVEMLIRIFLVYVITAFIDIEGVPTLLDIIDIGRRLTHTSDGK